MANSTNPFTFDFGGVGLVTPEGVTSPVQNKRKEVAKQALKKQALLQGEPTTLEQFTALYPNASAEERYQFKTKLLRESRRRLGLGETAWNSVVGASAAGANIIVDTVAMASAAGVGTLNATTKGINEGVNAAFDPNYKPPTMSAFDGMDTQGYTTSYSKREVPEQEHARLAKAKADRKEYMEGERLSDIEQKEDVLGNALTKHVGGAINSLKEAGYTDNYKIIEEKRNQKISTYENQLKEARIQAGEENDKEAISRDQLKVMTKTIESLADNPLLLAQKVIESAPYMFASGKLGSSAAKKAMKAGMARVRATALKEANGIVTKGTTAKRLEALKANSKNTHTKELTAKKVDLEVKQATEKKTVLNKTVATGKEAAQKKATNAAEKSAILSTGVMEGSGNAAEYKKEVLNTSFEDLRKTSDKFKEYEAEYGEEKARELLAQEGALEVGIESGIAAALVSKGTGGAKLEANLLSKLPKQSLRKTGADVVGASTKELLDEAGQSGSGTLVSNLVKQKDINPDQDLTKGLGRSAGEGAITGALSAGSAQGAKSTGTILKRSLEHAGKIPTTGISKGVSKTLAGAGKFATKVAEKTKPEAPVAPTENVGKDLATETEYKDQVAAMAHQAERMAYFNSVRNLKEEPSEAEKAKIKTMTETWHKVNKAIEEGKYPLAPKYSRTPVKELQKQAEKLDLDTEEAQKIHAELDTRILALKAEDPVANKKEITSLTKSQEGLNYGTVSLDETITKAQGSNDNVAAQQAILTDYVSNHKVSIEEADKLLQEHPELLDEATEKVLRITSGLEKGTSEGKGISEVNSDIIHGSEGFLGLADHTRNVYSLMQRGLDTTKALKNLEKWADSRKDKQVDTPKLQKQVDAETALIKQTHADLTAMVQGKPIGKPIPTKAPKKPSVNAKKDPTNAGTEIITHAPTKNAEGKDVYTRKSVPHGVNASTKGKATVAELDGEGLALPSILYKKEGKSKYWSPVSTNSKTGLHLFHGKLKNPASTRGKAILALRKKHGEKFIELYTAANDVTSPAEAVTTFNDFMNNTVKDFEGINPAGKKTGETYSLNKIGEAGYKVFNTKVATNPSKKETGFAQTDEPSKPTTKTTSTKKEVHVKGSLEYLEDQLARAEKGITGKRNAPKNKTRLKNIAKIKAKIAALKNTPEPEVSSMSQLSDAALADIINNDPAQNEESISPESHEAYAELADRGITDLGDATDSNPPKSTSEKNSAESEASTPESTENIGETEYTAQKAAVIKKSQNSKGTSSKALRRKALAGKNLITTWLDSKKRAFDSFADLLEPDNLYKMLPEGFFKKANVKGAEKITLHTGHKAAITDLIALKGDLIKSLGKSDIIKNLQDIILNNYDYRNQNLAAELLDDNGQLPMETVENMAAAMYLWMINDTSGLNYASDKTIRGILDLTDAERIPWQEVKLLRKAGFTKAFISKNLGKHFSAIMGYSQSEEGGENSKALMEASIGSVLFMAMQDLGYLPKEGTELSPASDENDQRKFVLYKLANEKKVNAVQERSKAAGHIINHLLVPAHENFKEFRLKPLAKFTQKYMRKTKQLLPKRVQNLMHTHSNIEHYVKKSTHARLSTMTRDQKARMLGSYSDAEIAAAPAYKRETMEATNHEIALSLDAYDTFIATLEGTENGLDTPFYFDHAVWKNLRMGMEANGGVNIQGNKYVRHLLGKGEGTRIDPANTENQLNFLLSVAQGLGIDTDKLLDNTSIEKLSKLLDKEMKNALASVKSLRENPEKNAKHHNEIILKVLEEKTHSYEALVEMELFLAGKEFTSYIAYETDGINNGPAIGNILYGYVKGEKPDLKAKEELLTRLKGAGFFSDGTTSYGQAKLDGTLDMYEDVGKPFADAMTPESLTLLSALGMELFDKAGNVKKAARQLIKDALVGSSYGQGTFSTSAALSNVVLNLLQDNLHKASNQQEFNNLVALLVPLAEESDMGEGQLKVINGLSSTNLGKFKQVGFSALQEDIVIKALQGTVGQAAVEAIEKRQAGVQAATKHMTAVTTLMDELYNIHLNNAKRAKENELSDGSGKFDKNIDTLNKKDLETVVKGIAQYLPTLPHFFSKKKDQELLLSKTATGASTRDVDTVKGVFGTIAATVKQHRPIGVSSMALSVHSIDAAIMMLTMEKLGIKHKGFTNIHDAVLADLVTIDEASTALNESTLEVISKMNPLLSVTEAMETMIGTKGYLDVLQGDADFTQIDKILIESKAYREAFEDYVDTVKNPIVEKYKALVATQNKTVEQIYEYLDLNHEISQEVLNTGTNRADFIKALVTQYKEIGKKQAAGKDDLINSFTHISQYHKEGRGINVENGKVTKATTSVQEVETTIADNIKKLVLPEPSKVTEKPTSKETLPELKEEIITENTSTSPLDKKMSIGNKPVQSGVQARAVLKAKLGTANNATAFLAARLLDFLPTNTVIEFQDEDTRKADTNLPKDSKGTLGYYQPARYDSEGKQLNLSPRIVIHIGDARVNDLASIAQTLSHELVHGIEYSILSSSLNKKQLARLEEIRAYLAEQAKTTTNTHLKSVLEAASKDIHETLAWGLTNNSVKKVLEAKRSRQKSTWGEKFLNLVYELLFPKTDTQKVSSMYKEVVAAFGYTLVQSNQGKSALMKNLTEARITTPEVGSQQAPAYQQAIQPDPLTHASATELLDKLDNNQSSEAHVEHLHNIIDRIDATVLTPLKARYNTAAAIRGLTLDDQLQELTQDPEAQIKNAGSLAGLTLTAQESYVNQLMNGVLEGTLEKGSVERTALDKLFQHAAKHIQPHDLMNALELEGLNQQEAVEHGYAIWESIFNPKLNKEGKSTYLREFAALGLSSEQFRKLLDELPQPSVAKKDLFKGGILNSLVNIIQALIEKVVASIADVDVHGNQLVLLDALSKRMAKVEVTQKSMLLRVAEAPLNLTEKSIELISKPVLGFTREALKVGGSFKGVRVVTQTAGALISPKAEYVGKVLLGASGLVGKGRHGFIAQIVHEMRTEVDADPTRPMSATGNVWLHDMAMSFQHEVDKVGMGLSESMQTELARMFQGTRTKKENVALNTVALRTDLSTLHEQGKTLEEIGSILSDERVRKTEINNKLKELSNLAPKNVVKYYENASQAMAWAMLTNQNKAVLTSDNPHTIANLYGTGKSSKGIDTNAAAEIINALGTLYAIDMVDTETMQTALPIYQREVSRDRDNGISFLLQMHTQEKANAFEKQFDKNPLNIRKGYLPSITNPYKDVAISATSNDPKLINAGYVLVQKRERDIHDVDGDRYIYVHPQGGMADYNSGVFYLADGMNSKGHNKDKSLQRLEAKQVQDMLKKKEALIAKMFTNQFTLNHNQTFQRPSFDSKGNVNGFAYSTDVAFQTKYLDLNAEFNHTFSKMVASNHTIPTGAEKNLELLHGLHESYMEDKANGNLGRYLKVYKDSTDPKLKEAWLMLPEEVQKKAKELFGGEFVPIRNDLYYDAFGYRKLTVRALWNKPEEAGEFRSMVLKGLHYLFQGYDQIFLAQLEMMLQETVSLVKDVVINKSVQIFSGNMASNTNYLVARGLSQSEAIKEQTRAFKYATDYSKQELEMGSLTLQLKTTNKTATRKKVQARINALTDSMARNPVKKMIDAGMLPTISEGETLTEDVYGSMFKSGLGSTLSNAKGIFGKTGETVIDEVAMTKETNTYKLLSKATQLSDFASRYALMNYLMKQEGKSFDAAKQDARKSFVNYDAHTHAALRYAGDMGFAWFLRYPMRMQKNIVTAIYNKPPRVAALILLNTLTGGVMHNVFGSLYGAMNPLSSFGFTDRIISGIGLHPTLEVL